MASAKEIRGQIKAIQNTAKITKAMEMVAASKMRKAQDRVTAGRAYAEGIKRVVANLMQAHPEYKHPFVVEREQIKRVGVILVNTDKGLCGGLNSNAQRVALNLVKDSAVPVEAYSIGRRAGQFMRKVVDDLRASEEEIPDATELSDVLGVVTVAMDRYIKGEVDEVTLIFTEFVNTMTQTPVKIQLLPCASSIEPSHPGYWDYIYEPDSKDVLDGLLRRYVESLVYHAVLENKACEHSARMVAMKSATDNAKEIAHDLKITYNKARQAGITQEIAEICSGAASAA
ncbi:MAG: F0F1 ATP synthase subunit gamma [Zetaproteobacteria bacterium CG12_big_fil_rev_8_21_14_0_65_54_13]|nr:MAG: F0F1 ATP synthase subunit gamma [Zetaproteobacteria bacterium CG23_combo_of_CG06-09_8_20_14_all_54_7]PIW51351.1 MAG: F0F1 ATP synthase subunit gamma [Zetaproteobacteria bacterium CG12_big_fil_rev_8_21_14_0_65_54_13]PIX54120.1 MAG: F0F1 ATP synthase subunit gamma [Zetaproteobacteria bacterium CG_4_10_14_3_um_filter_54_28]PJA31042.1 MAG: F0F1 ATP synthase subunit gamma [Zetaproteobacteria bacterium CG_4_9_14_3_um_filter_54_145]